MCSNIVPLSDVELVLGQFLRSREPHSPASGPADDSREQCSQTGYKIKDWSYSQTKSLILSLSDQFGHFQLVLNPAVL